MKNKSNKLDHQERYQEKETEMYPLEMVVCVGGELDLYPSHQEIPTHFSSSYASVPYLPVHGFDPISKCESTNNDSLYIAYLRSYHKDESSDYTK